MSYWYGCPSAPVYETLTTHFERFIVLSLWCGFRLTCLIRAGRLPADPFQFGESSPSAFRLSLRFRSPFVLLFSCFPALSISRK